ncbi:uncharacterized protein LOC107225650 isoform X2 [Neodiprion lecontei]|uniref:Uncharacterized protein LOC107225650 isoform X2 n=1 Tax=Neodiprion lecontei TaxID=441921 RepID=A0ABM3G1B3_NEOLC|nr:uncharacterized protein LOC124217690 isoform X2 [Neodiprion pinetum]XP_046594062.1 uncharacterized protein LOC107225650 isoform X2 [Neodiprion lecontei]
MYISWGEQQTLRYYTSHFSVIKINTSVTRRVSEPGYSGHNNDAELKHHYWAASFLLPFGSIFVLAIVVLLMVLFKRCPYVIAGVATSLLAMTVIFVIITSFNNTPLYS